MRSTTRSATLVQYEFSGTVTARDEFVPWSSTYTFTLVVDAGTRVATSFGYEIPLVASATLDLPYFSPDAIDITTPIRLGYNTTTNRVFFAATGTGHEDAYTITLTEPQENIFLNQSTFGPLTGMAAQFNFIGLRDIIGSGLPEHIVFTGGTVTAEVAASVAGQDRRHDVHDRGVEPHRQRQRSRRQSDHARLGAGRGRRHRQPVGRQHHLHADGELFRRGELHLHDPGFAGLTDTATVSFNINDVNDAPRARSRRRRQQRHAGLGLSHGRHHRWRRRQHRRQRHGAVGYRRHASGRPARSRSATTSSATS